MINRVSSLVWRYRGCLAPPLAVLAGFGVLILLAAILGDSRISQERIVFQSVFGASTKPALAQVSDIFETGLWWLFAVYLFWLTAIIGNAVCFYIVHRVLLEGSRAQRWIAHGALAVTVGAFVAILVAVGRRTTLVSAQDTIKPLSTFVGGGFRTLVELTFGFGIVSVVVVVLCAAIALVPVRNRQALLARMKYLHVLLYAGATVVVAWIVQARILYGFAATVLIEEQRNQVNQIAPTISLVVGATASLYLVLMYMAGFLWLQSRHADFSGKEDKIKSRTDVGGDSPLAILVSHWPRVFTFIGPAIPGVAEFLFNFTK